MAENETDEQQAERARRDAAAARRQRILEGAETRMDVVEGRQAATSTSSKLAAMRKRRFKKKTATSSSSGTTTETATASGGEEAAVSNAEPATSADTATSTATSPTAVVDDPPTATTSGDEVDDAGKKKYMGVARMRRKMIKEKQQQQQPTTAASTTDATAPSSKKRKSTPYATTVPILMHVVTVLLLFFAGLDIGLQQAPLSVDVMEIHTDFAPRHSGGVHRILQYTKGSSNTAATDDDNSSIKKKPTLGEQTYFHDAMETEDDEFEDASSKPLPIDIDPIFGVDLDELTAGPGLVHLAARQAVKVHRFLLRMLYYGPLRGIDWLLSLTTLPPVLCLVAILLRQLIGKTILGARLPSLTDTNNAKGDGDQAKGDVMGMAQNFVSNFLQTTFPTAVSLYDMWKHLRADMYVIFCGLFVGLAFGHHPSTEAAVAASAKDEL